MQGNKVVTVIPKTKSVKHDFHDQRTAKRKVAGYARVSTDMEQQQNSYQAQLDYYTTYIKGRPDWEFAGMYSDEGITGTSIKKRDGFNQMIEDALAGRIDLIVTKSVSRFARNTVDSLSTVRKLKDAGVEVYFEKENIYTFDQKGELLITIMSSLAQEESRSISENTTWGQRKRMADGHGCIGFSHFLGYEKGADGEFVVNEEQAKIVKRIFEDYLDGKNTSQIARELSEDGIKTVTGKDRWHPSTIQSILKNEKYIGDCLMQKYYVNDFLTKKLVKNEGELQQYYVKGHHEAIITEEVFNSAQRKLNSGRRKKHQSGARDFSSMVICGDCGSYYGSKVWHSTDKYRKIIYRCNNKYKGDKCSTPAVGEERLKGIFVEAINELYGRKDEMFDNLERLLEMKKERAIDVEIRTAAVELDKAEAKYRALIDKQKTSPVAFEDYEKQVKEVSQAYDSARAESERLEEERRSQQKSIYEIEQFMENMKEQDGAVAEYDGELMKRTVKTIRIYHDGRAVVEFLDGVEVSVWT